MLDSSLPVSRLDYLAVLAVGATTGLLVFGDQIRRLIQQPAVWVGTACFVLFSSVVEVTALRQGWWAFSEERLIGICFIGVPIEEFVLFVGAYLFTVAAWEFFRP